MGLCYAPPAPRKASGRRGRSGSESWHQQHEPFLCSRCIRDGKEPWPTISLILTATRQGAEVVSPIPEESPAQRGDVICPGPSSR